MDAESVPVQVALSRGDTLEVHLSFPYSSTVGECLLENMEGNYVSVIKVIPELIGKTAQTEILPSETTGTLFNYG